MRLAGHAARRGNRRGASRVLVGEDWMERNHLLDLGADGNIILKCILKKWDGAAWTGLMWLG